MDSILIKPRNIEELNFVNEFIKRTKLKSERFDKEEQQDAMDFRKGQRKVKEGKAEFSSLEEVKKMFDIQ